jgi:crotonobetainyl-CoA:carnitine CoA-transferase CaiB-like acyl-CoA transferase
MADAPRDTPPGPFTGLRVLEIADEKAALCGKLFAANGAEVIKIEPPTGDPSRHIGPFVHDRPDPERSLHFWHYNVNKRGITLDVTRSEGQDLFRRLIRTADVLIDATPLDFLAAHHLDYTYLCQLRPELVMASITPFGQTGPARHDKTSDLLHLALGGQMAVCGYDPDAHGCYDTPPIAPQMWHAYHITSHFAFLGIAAALFYRTISGQGQFLDLAIHDCCALATEWSAPYYLYSQQILKRQTNRHAFYYLMLPASFPTRDGKHVWAGIAPRPAELRLLLAFLTTMGMDGELQADPRFQDEDFLASYEARARIVDRVAAYIAQHTAEEVYRAAQAHNLAWGVVRRPEDNLNDPHMHDRGMFDWITHPDCPELPSLPYVSAPWIAPESPWRLTQPAPRLGQHNVDIYGALGLSHAEIEELHRRGVL